MAKKRSLDVRRGNIFLVRLDPIVGSEIKKTRPALVVQNDVTNKYSSTTIVAPISSSDPHEKVYPTEVLVRKADSSLKNDSLILLSQIRTVDKARLIRKLGSVDKVVLDKVDLALEISLGIMKF